VPLLDPYGRKAISLRMALTSRCNLRCIYCHREGESAPGSEISKEMVVCIAKAASELGFRSIKFTGGDPLMRSDLEAIISEMLMGLDLSITTNGIGLDDRAKRLKEAGLTRVNVSLVSLNPAKYRRITGCRVGDLEEIKRGIDAALEAGLSPVKLNVVLLKENQDEVWDMVDFARRKGLILQLIELLDLMHLGISGDMDAVEEALRAKADNITIREMHRRRKYHLSGVEVEVVRPMDNTEFCANCTRLRVTSDARLKPCLLRNDNLVDIGTCDISAIKDLIIKANSRREPYFKNVSGPR
jgi:GTP 3',8-cyclase